jgi:hypothetical protein
VEDGKHGKLSRSKAESEANDLLSKLIVTSKESRMQLALDARAEWQCCDASYCPRIVALNPDTPLNPSRYR